MAAPRSGSAQQGVGRRQMLAGAGVAVGGLAVAGVAGAGPAAADHDSWGRLSGSWLVTRQDDGDPERVQGILSFAGGDVMIVKDLSPAGPPFTGTWERREGRRFRATVWTGFPGDEGPGSAGPSVRVRLRGRVEAGRLTGTYRVTGFDPETDDVVFTATGSFRGRRIDA